MTEVCKFSEATTAVKQEQANPFLTLLTLVLKASSAG